jgi:hypothetical protein
MITKEIAAVLALRVYEQGPIIGENLPLEPQGWEKLLNPLPVTDGFAYGVFRKIATNEIVISDASDVFLHREKTGRVDSYIKCSNCNVPAPPCRHDFSLEPYMQAQVYVQYRRNQLPSWRDIQAAVTQQILDFEMPPRKSTNLKP